MHNTQNRLHQAALMAGAAVLALLATGCSTASAGAQTGGCRDNGDWSDREQAAWLRKAVAFHRTTEEAGPSYEGASVVVRAQHSGDERPLCRPLAVQVQFWTLTATATGTERASVMRYRLSADGSRTRTVGFPAALPTGQDGACTRVLVAAYAGAPLSDRELPRKTRGLATAGEADVRFRTERIGAYRLLPPRDPAPCDADRPALSPSPTRSETWDIYHP